jgi:hypothetical protein
MRLRKPHLKDNLPTQLCLLCNRAFCVDHKGKEDGVCEINHETYYRNHPAAQECLYRTYEDWKRDSEQVMVDKASRRQGGKPKASPWADIPHVARPKSHEFDMILRVGIGELLKYSITPNKHG